MNNRPKRLLIMAGGTGGHVFPGLAVAHYLLLKGWQVRWIGTADRMEAHLVPQHGIEIDFIHVTGLRGRGWRAWLRAPITILRAAWQAQKIIRHYRPDVILGMGGYVAGPGCLAAWLCRVPVVLHEQNAVAGLTNRWLAKFATKVMQAFAGALGPTAEVVGNPLRAEIVTLSLPVRRFIERQGALRVLVIGGSQGAQVLNRIMPLVAATLQDRITVWHQTGPEAQAEVARAYQAAVLASSPIDEKQQAVENSNSVATTHLERITTTAAMGTNAHNITAFIDDMAAAYAWADVIICRSGALTVSEIAVVGLPAIFVPFQHQDRQQYLNAVPLEKAGAAKIIEQAELTPAAVSNLLAHWDRPTLMKMAKRAQSIAINNATERVANAIVAISKKSIK